METFAPLPLARRTGTWIEVSFEPDGGRGYRALCRWLRFYGFRIVRYDGLALDAKILFQRGHIRELVGVIVDHSWIWLTKSARAEQLASVLRALEAT